jgi:hypothetical protein
VSENRETERESLTGRDEKAGDLNIEEEEMKKNKKVSFLADKQYVTRASGCRIKSPLGLSHRRPPLTNNNEHQTLNEIRTRSPRI